MLDQSAYGSVARESSQTNAIRQPNETMFPVLWRYRWLLVGCAFMGTVAGFCWHADKPTTYRATTRVMFRCDTPLSLDAVHGVVRGGIPSGKLVQSLIRSESIMRRVADDDRLMNQPGLSHLNRKQRVRLVRDGVVFTALTDTRDSPNRLIASLHFEGEDRDVCRAAINAISSAIKAHFQDEREESINEFASLIDEAQNILLPQQRTLEREYQAFRRRAALEWAADGSAVNPHRSRQRHLQGQREIVELEAKRLEKELLFMRRIRRQHDDPSLIGQILTHLGDEAFSEGLGLIDRELQNQRNDVKNHLLPLSLRLEELELELGKSHPEVLAVRRRLERSHEHLQELSQGSLLYATDHEGLTLHESRDARDGLSKAATLDVLVSAYEERLLVTKSQLGELDRQIESEKHAADQLKHVEDEDTSFRRRIASMQGMLIQLEEQLAAIDLADVSGGILVEPLIRQAETAVTGPSLHRDLALSGLLGGILGGVLAILMEWSARTFRSAEEIQEALKLPVLTHIPIDKAKPSRTRCADAAGSDLDRQVAIVHRPYSPAAEAIRGLRTALLLRSRKDGSRVFQITSPLPGDGKSTLAANVAASIAQSGKRTLVIDLDLRSPRLSLRFKLQSKLGLANVLNNEIPASEAIHSTSLQNLDVLPCGPLPSNPSEALTLGELGELIQWARENYDFVIIDSPPVLMVSDPTIVTPMVDAAILVMRIKRRSRPNAAEAVSLLQWTGTQVMGVVVNKLRRHRGFQNYECSARGTYQSYGYGHGDRYRRRYQKEVESKDTYLVTGADRSRRIDHPKAVDDSSGTRSAHPAMNDCHLLAPRR
ncbi:MAG: polysaccharide biosynthesis tyrosine autokinase [Planctomycetota bacterium]